MIDMKFKKAARDLSDAAFEYAELIEVTEYRFDNEMLIFASERDEIEKARKKPDDQKFMYHVKARYNSGGAKKITELAGNILPTAAAEAAKKEYPRLEKGVPREPEKSKKGIFFGKGKAGSGGVVS